MRRVALCAVATTSSALIGWADGCPIMGGGKSSKEAGGGCPVGKAKEAAGCPVKHGGKTELDPRNQMPAKALQDRAQGQTEALSTERVASTIPKVAEDGTTWEYPSPQMFWNALVRKGRADGASEADMETVVAVHNNMNEVSWKAVLEWEAMHGCKSPKLARFVGRPQELSPKAWLKTLFGHPKPFDRHDWVVDRDGHKLRYIIDYYSDDSKSALDVTPKLRDTDAVKSILVDVRPALDSPEAFIDRIFSMPQRRARGEASPVVPFFASSEMQRAAVEAQKVPELVPVKAEQTTEKIGRLCSARFEALRDCGEDNEKCASASIALQHCVASVICPKEAAEFAHAAKHDPKNADKVYAKMDAALESFAKKAKQQPTP